MQIRNGEHNAPSIIMQSYANGMQCTATRVDTHDTSRNWVHSEYASCQLCGTVVEIQDNILSRTRLKQRLTNPSLSCLCVWLKTKTEISSPSLKKGSNSFISTVESMHAAGPSAAGKPHWLKKSYWLLKVSKFHCLFWCFHSHQADVFCHICSALLGRLCSCFNYHLPGDCRWKLALS